MAQATNESYWAQAFNAITTGLSIFITIHVVWYMAGKQNPAQRRNEKVEHREENEWLRRPGPSEASLSPHGESKRTRPN